MAIAFQSQNPSFRKTHWLLRFAAGLALLHGGALVLLFAFAVTFGVL